MNEISGIVDRCSNYEYIGVARIFSAVGSLFLLKKLIFFVVALRTRAKTN